MSRFSKQSPGTKTTNLAGGSGFSQTAALELTSILLTSFVKDQFYRSANDTLTRVKELIAGIPDKKFIAQLAVYARTKFGMRSITHVVASELAKFISSEPWAKHFYNAIIYRPDDMIEIMAYHLEFNGKVTNSMRKGFAKAFTEFSSYELAKYRGEGKSVKLVDVANIVHPKPINKEQAETFHDLMTGKLKSTETWEALLSEAGQGSKTDAEKAEAKAKVWKTLLTENKLGYFALLRNLRNIALQAPGIMPLALEQLQNEEVIKKSLVLPFRFTTAYETLKDNQDIPGGMMRQILTALNKSVDKALSNIPQLPGKNLVILDISSSMRGRPAEIGSLFAAVLAKGLNADVVLFGEDAKYLNYNAGDSTITLADSFRFDSGGTNFPAAFQILKEPYDRVVILSDMQGWMQGHDSPVAEYNKWKKRTNADPFVYSFDLKGYGTMMMPERNVICLTGFSDKIFDIMRYTEEDKDALINTIKQTTFSQGQTV